MTKSRKTAFAVLLLASSGARAAEPVTAEQATERYRQTYQTVDDLDCPPAKGDEIVVCGMRGEDRRHRLPLPLEAEPGQVVPDERWSTQHMMTLDKNAPCVSNKGCAKASIPLFGAGHRAPGTPPTVADTIMGAINKIILPN